MGVADTLIKILAELIVLSVVNLLPMRRLNSIDHTLKAVRRDLRRVRERYGRRLDDHQRRLDRHDTHAGINTKEP